MKYIQTFENFINEALSNKADIIANFIKTYADDDEIELLDMNAEINDIQKMANRMGRGSFIVKLQSVYPRAEKKDINDFFDSIK